MGTKRKSDIWISNNRVLVGGNKKVTGRNPNFDMEETKLLISLWGDPKVQKTLITAHKKHAVIVKLAEKMREYGYFRSPEEINTRIKNLKCFYNRIKKAMEMGIASEPTWKHYQAMDDIMTRPIFSVRPNEIPKPSLRYRLEEEMRDKEMNEKSEKDSEATGSEDDDKMSITEEMFEEEMAQEDTDIDEEEDKFKKEVDTSSDVEETPLIIPKQEPIDVDDELDAEKQKEDEDNNDIFPKLSAYLQLASNTSSSTTNGDNNKIITTISSSVLSSVSDTTTTTTPGTQLKLSQPIVISNQQTPQAGKISLVPTNFLLKPQQPQIQIRPQTQHRILYTKPSGQSTQGIVTSGTGQMPMKVLLVNTLQKSTGSANTVCSTDSQSKTLTAASIQPQIRPAPSPAPDKNQDTAATKKKEEVTGLKSLLKQLVQLQGENLEVNRQRLDVERQRLDFEKSAVERIINAVSLFQIPNGSPPLLKPKVEKEE